MSRKGGLFPLVVDFRMVGPIYERRPLGSEPPFELALLHRSPLSVEHAAIVNKIAYQCKLFCLYFFDNKGPVELLDRMESAG